MSAHDQQPERSTVRPVQLEALEAGGGSGRNLLDANMEVVQDVKVSLAILLGSTQITIGELFALKEGTLLKLDRLTSEPVEILLDGRRVARGELMAAGDHFAVRITEVGGKG